VPLSPRAKPTAETPGGSFPTTARSASLRETSSGPVRSRSATTASPRIYPWRIDQGTTDHPAIAPSTSRPQPRGRRPYNSEYFEPRTSIPKAGWVEARRPALKDLVESPEGFGPVGAPLADALGGQGIGILKRGRSASTNQPAKNTIVSPGILSRAEPATKNRPPPPSVLAGTSRTGRRAAGACVQQGPRRNCSGKRTRPG